MTALISEEIRFYCVRSQRLQVALLRLFGVSRRARSAASEITLLTAFRISSRCAVE
jgi:hypothetical protein